MIRNTNPLESVLIGCESHYIWANDSIQSDQTLNEIAGIGGNVEQLGAYCHMRFPHSKGDAYTGLMLAREIGVSNNGLLQPNLLSGSFNGWEYCHFILRTGSVLNSPANSFTQMLLSRLCEAFESSLADGVSIATTLDSIPELSEDKKWGNSFAIVNLTLPQTKLYSSLHKNAWRLTLNDRAKRTLEILRRKGQGFITKPGSILLSSLGNLSLIPWMPKISPERFLMVSNPTSVDSGNIVTWATGNIQALTICASPKHFLIRRKDELFELWASLCQKKY